MMEACYEIDTGYITNLEGLIIPETSLSIVRVVILVKGTPKSSKADSAMLRIVLVRVGRARLPTWHLACTVRFSNLTSTFGRFIPTLHKQHIIVTLTKIHISMCLLPTQNMLNYQQILNEYNINTLYDKLIAKNASKRTDICPLD